LRQTNKIPGNWHIFGSSVNKVSAPRLQSGCLRGRLAEEKNGWWAMLFQILQNINNTFALVDCTIGFLMLFIGLLALASYARHF
jgi:hypothetical protein